MASLAGLEQALEEDDPEFVEMAIRRILLLHGVTLSIGGIPLLYLGEEWGMLNDYDFVKDPAKAGDTRWIHRPKMKWEYLEELNTHTLTANASIHARIFQSIRKLILLRQDLPAVAGQDMQLISLGNPHVLGFLRAVKATAWWCWRIFPTPRKPFQATRSAPQAWVASFRMCKPKKLTPPPGASTWSLINSSGCNGCEIDGSFF